MRLNHWIIPEGNIAPQQLVDIVLETYTRGHGLHLSLEGRELLRDLLLVVMEDYQDALDEYEESEKVDAEALKTMEAAHEAAQTENVALQVKVEALEADLVAARQTIAVIQAGQANALMWKDGVIPAGWDKVTKEP
jgi:hypothetical protein